MRIPSGSTDRKVYFVAVDATDLKTRETGLSSFTVVRSRDGAADVTYTTPTVTEIDATTMPGVYALTLDEDTTVAAGHDTEEYCLHITQASMAPVTRVIELYRVKFSEGQSATMANSAVDADVERWLGTAVAAPTVAGVPEVDVTHVAGAAEDIATGAEVAGVQADTDNIQTRLPAALVSGRIDASVGAMASGVITAAAHAAGAIDAAAIATDAIGSAEFAQAAADKIWASAARSLTDKAGFALAAGEYTALVNLIWDELTSEGRTAGSFGQKLKDLVVTAAGRVDVGQWLGSVPNALVSGDVPANVRAFLAGAITAAAFAVDSIDAVALKADAAQEVADALLDRASAVEGFTPRQVLRLFAAALVGKADGLATTTAHYRDVADTKNRITATVDADGNRTAVTLDAS